MENKIIGRGQLEDILVAMFDKAGVSREDTLDIANTLIQAEQWGVTSHGLLRVEHYIRCLQSGGILPKAEFTVEKQFGGWVSASAGGGLGIPASCKATKLAIELAKEHGIAVVNLKESHHNGAEGVSEIFYPGELELRRAAAAGDTVSLLSSTWEKLQQGAGYVGMTI